MKRQIIKIDEEKCNGCQRCVSACHEGALQMVNGKAKLVRDDYCDGLGACLPTCPTGAISFEEREALPFDEAAALANSQPQNLKCGCPGTNLKTINRDQPKREEPSLPYNTSQLNQWPIQIKLVPVNASFFKNAKLLIAADCAAFAYGDFHNRFIKNHITLIGCPKLDATDYSNKLTAILKENDIKSLTVARMEVPCCGGLENAVKTALKNSGKLIPWQIVTISTDGTILD